MRQGRLFIRNVISAAGSVRSLKAAFLVLGGLFFGIACRSQAGDRQETVLNTTTRQIPAPTFTLKTLSGEEFSLTKKRGKVVFLEFWATWCPPCAIASPEVDKVAHEYRGKDVTFLSVSLDDSEAPVRAFMAAKKLSNPVALAGDSGVDLKYQVRGIPAFFLIDKNGFVVEGWEGYNPAMIADWRKEIDRLLKA